MTKKAKEEQFVTDKYETPLAKKRKEAVRKNYEDGKGLSMESLF